MNTFKDAINLMNEQFGHDVVIALATRTENGVNVRIVNGYYKDDAFYVVSHNNTHKIKEINKNPNVAICKDLMNTQGIAENLGNPKLDRNLQLRDELKKVFVAFYDRHVNENDPDTCIIKIKLTNAVAFSNDTKYIIDYKNGTAIKYAFKNDIIM